MERRTAGTRSTSGAAVQSVPHLVDRTDEAGCVTPGRLNLPAIVTLFGEGAFTYPCPAPWRGVLNNSRPATSIAIGLRLDLEPVNYKLPGGRGQ